MNHRSILVIRRGAVGDTVVLLPVVRSLRECYPRAHLELAGNAERLALAVGPCGADRCTSLELPGLQHCFFADGGVSADMRAYFNRFDAVLAFLSDEDDAFRNNVTPWYRGTLRVTAPLPPPGVHAVDHLLDAVRLEGFRPGERVPRVEIGAADAAFAAEFWRRHGLGNAAVTAVHPGSGGRGKCWPPERFAAVIRGLAASGRGILLVSGPADGEHVRAVRDRTQGIPLLPAEFLPLGRLAALLARCGSYLGNDSGISHLAAAAGAPSVVLFGPTDPAQWVPRGERVTALRAPGGRLEALPAERVLAAMTSGS